MVPTVCSNAKLIVMILLCSYWIEANGWIFLELFPRLRRAKIDTPKKTTKISADKLKYWTGGNITTVDDARRAQRKRQKQPEKSRRVFRPMRERRKQKSNFTQQMLENDLKVCLCKWTKFNEPQIVKNAKSTKKLHCDTQETRPKGPTKRIRKYRFRVKSLHFKWNPGEVNTIEKNNINSGNESKAKMHKSSLSRLKERPYKKIGRRINQDTDEIDGNNVIFDKHYLRRARYKHSTGVATARKRTITTRTTTTRARAVRQKEEPSTNDRPLVDEYLSPYGVMAQMTRILQSFVDANVTTEILGRTAEYNDIALFKISGGTNETAQRFRAESKYMDEAPEKKIVFIVHGLTVMGLGMLSCLTEEDKLKILIGYYLSHLDKFDIFLIPIANPDGYVASRTGGFWNKNRSPQKDCSGVMLDRNFDVAWNQTHQLSSCSQAYPGPTPFSEAETRAVRDVFHYHGHKIIGYIHVHAGTYDTGSFKGDAILYPKGYTDVQSDDDKYIDLKGEIEEAMKNASFQVMSVNVDTLHSWYGKITGTSVDYAASVYGIPYAMEFVMQLYASNVFASEDEDLVEYCALTQIWRRMIDVVFNYFAKSLQTPSNDARKMVMK